ncbi:hypothetical protein LIA77_06965 [Sarocladium implicatum]|nr:hypothetical protein LIA77_06965 [Sarocladium implicatum]
MPPLFLDFPHPAPSLRERLTSKCQTIPPSRRGLVSLLPHEERGSRVESQAGNSATPNAECQSVSSWRHCGRLLQ